VPCDAAGSVIDTDGDGSGGTAGGGGDTTATAADGCVSDVPGWANLAKLSRSASWYPGGTLSLRLRFINPTA
jgi:hypothetical protein